RRACKSVFATINSTSFIPASIMRFTALPPPPPTPMTLILASLRASSLKLLRIPVSLFISTAITEFSFPWGSASILLSVGVTYFSSSLERKQRLQTRTPSLILQTSGDAGAMGVEHHAQRCRILRFGQDCRHSG